ncbi:MAG: sarcosine oxidase subunit delta [Thiohalospira sp.]
MKRIPTPDLGERPVDEFVYGGAVHPLPEPETTGDADWGRAVFHRAGAPGTQREWWFHAPSGTWYIAERNTATDHFGTVAPAGEVLHG